LLKAGKSHSRRKREAGHQTTLFLVTGSAFSLWLCRRLNFAAPRLVTMLFQPNGLVALFAAKPFRRTPRLKRGVRASLLLDWFTFAFETPLISQTGRSEEKASPPIAEPRNSKR
jgi:hypothetical protein